MADFSDVHALLDRAVKDGHIREATKHSYAEWFDAILRLNGNDPDALLGPRAIEEVMALPNLHTRRNYINCILAIFKYSTPMREGHPGSLAAWKAAFEVVNAEMTARYESNAPSERQRLAFIPWQEVLDRRDKMDPDSVEYLLVCCYSMIPTLRADFASVRIHTREPTDGNVGNYLVVSSEGEKYARLVLNDFKSKGKAFPRYDKLLPLDLEAVIRRSLVVRPRSYLFVPKGRGRGRGRGRPHDGEGDGGGDPDRPYPNDNAYIKFVNKAFGRHLGHGITIGLLRHIFVSSLDQNRMTLGDKRSVSRDMLHSVEMSDQYRLIF